MFVPKDSAPENHIELIQLAARRQQQLALANPCVGYAAGEAYARSFFDNMPTAIMFDLTEGDPVTGFQPISMTEAEQKTAWVIARASKVDHKMRVSPAGQVALRENLAKEAKHVTQFLKEQDLLALEAFA